MNKDETTTVKIPILNPVPLFILFRALGVETDREIINFIVHDENDTEMINLLRKSLEDSAVEGKDIKILNQDDALTYLISKMRVVKKYNETDMDIKIKQKNAFTQLIKK